MVTIIIPFKDNIKLLSKCIESIFMKTVNIDFEIILVNNQSHKKNTISKFYEIAKRRNVSLMDYDLPFNFSAINNFAARYAKYKFLLFLNNDTEIITKNWLKLMLFHFNNPKTGVVGAKLLYSNDKIQHAGIFCKNKIIGHLYRKMTNTHTGNEPFNSIYEPDAVTAACMMTSLEIFQRTHGFDANNLPVAYNDVDYCFKVRSLGYKIIYDPNVELYHYESASRINDAWSFILNRKRYKQFQNEKKIIKNRWNI